MADRAVAISPIRFIEALIDPETGAPFVLTDVERAFLARAFELGAAGRLRYPELVFSAPKKSGKTCFGAMVLLYAVCAIGGRFAEGYVGANSLEQSTGRVFQACARIVQATPFLKADAKVTIDTIAFRSSGATIKALPNDFAGAAGSNPTITVFDELWAFTSEAEHRFWDEMVPPPTRQIACRLTVSYAGFEGESELLEALYRRGLKGELIGPDLYAQPGLLMFWSHRFTAPWQSEAWREQMRGQLRPNAYLRLIENRWVTSESTFVDLDWWDACVDAGATPMMEDRRLSAWLGVDASLKRDSTAIVAVAYDEAMKRVRLLAHRVFQPRPDDPLDFEATVETTVLDFCHRFRVVGVNYDPWQMQAVAQRLMNCGVRMEEYPQTVSNLTEASNNLYELVKGRNLVAYPDGDMRLAVQRAVAKETPRGWKIAKETVSHKIDVVVALAMACRGAVGQMREGGGAAYARFCHGVVETMRSRGAGIRARWGSWEAALTGPGVASPEVARPEVAVPPAVPVSAVPPEESDPYLVSLIARNRARAAAADVGNGCLPRGPRTYSEALSPSPAPAPAGMVRLIGKPGQGYYVSGANGRNFEGAADRAGVLLAPSEYVAQLERAGCRRQT